MPDHNGPPAPNDDIFQLARELAAQLVHLQKDTRTVREIVDAYLPAIKEEVSRRNYLRKAEVLSLFAADFGDRAIGDCNALLLQEWIRNHKAWVSGWTRGGVTRNVNACLNWAVRMGLCRLNPFKGVHYQPGPPGRAMTDAEFRCLLRHSPAPYRRFLFALRWTGARPKELCSLRWPHVVWERSLAVLAEHKSFKKTRQPRRIVLPAVMLRLLAWMKRQPRLEHSATAWLREQLVGGPLTRAELNQRARGRGIPYTQLDWARESLGVVTMSCGGGKHRRVWYALPATAPETTPKTREPESRPDGHVFLNSRGTPLTKGAIDQHLLRVRQVAGADLPARGGCNYYSLRHRYGSELVKAGVNLHVVALLMGHSDVDMVVRFYSHVGDDTEHLLSQAEKIAALGLGNGQPPRILLDSRAAGGETPVMPPGESPRV